MKVNIYKLHDDGTISKHTGELEPMGDGFKTLGYVKCPDINFECTVGWNVQLDEVSRECRTMISFSDNEELVHDRFMTALENRMQRNADRIVRAEKELEKANAEKERLLELIHRTRGTK